MPSAAPTRPIYAMANNENPLGPSPAVIEAIQRNAVTLGSYPPFTDDTLRVALAGSHGRGLTPDYFVTANGGCEVLELIARAFVTPGDAAITSPPTFPIYAATVGTQGGELIQAGLEAETFAYSVDRMLAAVTERTRLLYVCSPNNPTGGLITAAELARLLADLPPEVLVVYDEVYYHFVTQIDRPDPVGHVLAGDNLIVLHSFSKAYGMAGMRLGYAIARPEIAQQLERLRRPFHLSTLALEAGLAAIGDQAHVQKAVEMTVAGREWLYGQLQELGLRVWPGQGNFLLFACPVPATEWATALEGYGILVRPAFGLPDYLRVSVGLPAANRAFVEALEEIMAHG